MEEIIIHVFVNYVFQNMFMSNYMIYAKTGRRFKYLFVVNAYDNCILKHILGLRILRL